MKNLFSKNGKLLKFQRFFTIFLIITIVAPNAFLFSATTASADETAVEESTPSAPIESTEATAESNIPVETEAPEQTPAPEETAPVPEPETVIETSLTPTITPNQTPITPTEPADPTEPGTTDQEPSGGGSAQPQTAGRETQYGSITICNLIINPNGNFVHGPQGLPSAHFQTHLIGLDRTHILLTQGFSTETHVPNRSIIGANNANCETHSGLGILNVPYLWESESISGASSTAWKVPRYSDQDTGSVQSLDDFYTRVNDGPNHANADGEILLTAANPHRTLIILNQYENIAPPPITHGSITVCNLVIDANGGIVRGPQGVPNAFFGSHLIGFNRTQILRTFGFHTRDITTNASIMTTNDAQCQKFEGLAISETPYLWLEESITEASSSAWRTPRYNDDYLPGTSISLNNFHAYNANDPVADGSIKLTAAHPDRIILFLNQYNTVTPPPTSGTIRVCKLINDPNNNAMRSSVGLPAGAFSVSITDSNNANSRSAQFDTTSFAADTTTIGITDAQCRSFDNLPFSAQPYKWSAEQIQNASSTTWQAPRYSDQDTGDAHSFDDLYVRVNDGPNHANADGEILLNATRPFRTILVLNKFSPADNGPFHTAPVITLLGDNPMSVTVGNTFTDPGATAVDDAGHDITSRIVTTGTVDTATIGSYTRAYSVTDTNGLSSVVTRTVNVVAGNITPPPPPPDRNGGGGGGGSRRKTTGAVLGAATEPTICQPFVIDFLHRNRQNNPIEVVKLQSFLKYFEGFSDLQTTGVFDQATFDAVSKFQEKYAADILKPWGYDKSTGYVYILTKKKINEIFCRTAFPISALQAQEIANYKAFLADQKTRTESLKALGDSPTDEEILKDIKDNVGLAEPTTTQFAILTPESPPNTEQISPNRLKDIASAIFSLPTERGMLFQSLYFLVIALIIVYLAVEIIVGMTNTDVLNKYQLWARKFTGYLIGLVLAILIALIIKIYSIIIPLILIAIAAGAVLAWTITKRTGNQVIPLPPSKR